MPRDRALSVLSADDRQLPGGGGAQPPHRPRHGDQGLRGAGGGLQCTGGATHTIQVRHVLVIGHTIQIYILISIVLSSENLMFFLLYLASHICKVRHVSGVPTLPASTRWPPGVTA